MYSAYLGRMHYSDIAPMRRRPTRLSAADAAFFARRDAERAKPNVFVTVRLQPGFYASPGAVVSCALCPTHYAAAWDAGEITEEYAATAIDCRYCRLNQG